MNQNPVQIFGRVVFNGYPLLSTSLLVGECCQVSTRLKCEE